MDPCIYSWILSSLHTVFKLHYFEGQIIHFKIHLLVPKFLEYA